MISNEQAITLIVLFVESGEFDNILYYKLKKYQDEEFIRLVTDFIKSMRKIGARGEADEKPE